MSLTADQQKLVDELASNKGPEWDRFRARKNSWIRKNFSETEAVKLALEPIMPGDVIAIDRNQSSIDDFREHLSTLDWREYLKPGACALMLLLTTGYQIYAQHDLYASGPEGVFLATMLELVLTCLAMATLRGFWQNAIRYGLIGFLIAHMAMTMSASAVKSVTTESVELNRLNEQYAAASQLLTDIPQSRIKDRLAQSQIVDKISTRITDYQASVQADSNRLFGGTDSDIRARIRWINLMAQLFFAHALGLMLSKMVPHGTFSTRR